MRGILSTTVVICLLFISIWLMPSFARSENSMSPLPEPEIHIGSEKEKITVKTNPVDPEYVHMEIIVQCRIPQTVPNSVQVLVDITVNGGGWEYTHTDTLEFNKGIVQDFFITAVLVPLEANYRHMHNITYTGTWRYSIGTQSGDVEPFTIPIVIEPSGFITLEEGALEPDLNTHFFCLYPELLRA